jgi:2-dehydropantoate 2-reductase
MKITIFGAGAVGGHLAAKLGAGAPGTGLEIAAVARGVQLAAMQEHGVTLHIGDERWSARPLVTDRPEELGPQDVVIVTLKAPALTEAAPALAT